MALVPFEPVVVGVVLLGLILVLFREWLRPGVAFVVAVLALLVSGIISPSEALMGFANEQLGVIVLLLLLSNTLRKSGFIDKVFNRLFSTSNTENQFLTKMTLSVGGVSAFMNNTPLVAIMMPYVYSWCEEKKVSASKFLLPLSYASILGGSITLIGTSTNLIVNGLAMEYGAEGLAIFDFLPLGIPALLFGFLYMYFFSGKILRESPNPIEASRSREYFVETHIEKKSRLIGKTVEEASLRKLKRLFLVEVRRDKKDIAPVPRDLILEESDKLFFAGDPAGVADLASPSYGLSLPMACRMPRTSMKRVVEIVIAPTSSLIGEKVKDTDFRNTYNGAILGIHRGDERLKGKIGDIELRGGDVLLVIAGSGFLERVEASREFFMVSQVKEIPSGGNTKAIVLLLGLLASIVLASLGWVNLLTSLLALLVLSLAMGLSTPKEIKETTDFNLILIIALGLAFGKGMINSGLAEITSNAILGGLNGFGITAVLAGIFIITNLLSSFMTSKAAVALILPVSLSIAYDLGAPVEPFILIVAFAGASNFITPIGYQTNLMVFSPGGYNFMDYFRFGLPITIICLLIAIISLNLVYGL